ncbi:MAG TPA: SdpI family protein [Gemmatimonadaceae bacterium]|nr:SdpI family protein [Gemmatimonadaceae bacterium]
MMRRLVQPLLVALAFIASALAWGRLPGRVPMHWNLAGEVDRYGSRLSGAFMIPLMMLFIWGMMRVLPKIDPRRANYAKMEGTYELVITMVLASTLVLHVVMLGAALGYPIAIDTVVPLVIGALFMVLGNVLPRAKPNWWFGVRTPWTLSNDRVWVRTHRVAGYTMLIAGLALVVLAFIPGDAMKLALLVGAGLAAGVPVVYSYIAWRQENTPR